MLLTGKHNRFPLPAGIPASASATHMGVSVSSVVLFVRKLLKRVSSL